MLFLYCLFFLSFGPVFFRWNISPSSPIVGPMHERHCRAGSSVQLPRNRILKFKGIRKSCLFPCMQSRFGR
ncbi:unnamed protein product [Strongylus vulgaris]|uniref:Secreted protein n=1 Tax=Strongylus vulgaris TaxID=40348 RepID=A0A3P7L631_STRVU|nr:unnamed protein product [Strongylus vulgaris]